MWNCCVARNELRQGSVTGTSGITPRNDYGQSGRLHTHTHTHTHTPAFCWSRMQLQSWSFTHLPSLPLPEFSLILDATQERYISQMKHQLDTTLCRFYFCRVTLHDSGASAHHQEYLKLVQRPLVHVLSLQVSHHICLLGPKGPNKEM